MPIKLNGSTSGYTQIQAAAVAGNNTLTLPTSGTNLLADNGSGALTIQTINSGTGNALTLQSNNATAMTIATSGNVGIGTTSGTNTVSSGLAINNATAANYPGLEIQTAGVTRMYINANNAASYITSVSTNPLVFTTNSAEAMRIDSSGNVGIGTTTPNAVGKLAVITGTNFPGLYITDGTYSGAITPSSLGGMALVSNGAYPQIFYVNSGERMRIDSSGNLLVGTTSTVASAKLSLSTATTGFGAYVTAGAGAGIGLDLQRTVANGDICYFRSPTALAGYITVSGSVCTYNSISDERLKTNIVASEDAIPKVLAMQVRNFDWKDGSGKVPFGFIAQELATVAPEAVTVGRDKEDGSFDTPWALDSSVLVPYLVKAIQELSAKLDAQAADIAALKAKVGAAQ